MIKACERSGHSGVCIGLGTWEALPPRDRCQLDNSGPDSPEHYVHLDDQVGDSRLSTARRSNEGVCEPL